jgi:hypothetical protein
MKNTVNKIRLTRQLTEQEMNLLNAISSLKSITHSFFVNSELQGDDEIRKEIYEIVKRLEELQSQTSVNSLFNKILDYTS